MKIQLELTKKSFRALYTNDFQDICANIFINGDFVHSRVLRSNTARCFTADQKDQAFGGRRIDTYLEIPWVILPMAQKDTPSDQAHASSSFKDRWDQVNQLLLKEADLWGRTGKYDMFRAPVGEYLAELSKKPIPESINGKERTACKAGIIDVGNRVYLETSVY
jgi:hypothetical protein